jgi:hypothetical protein
MDNRVEIIVGTEDNSSFDLEALKKKLSNLGNTVETARVRVAGNREAEIQVAKMQAQLAALGKKVSNPKIDIEGAAAAHAKILGLELSLDHLNSKLNRTTGFRGMLNGLAVGFANAIGPASGLAGTIGLILIPILALLGILAGPMLASFAPIIAGFVAFGAGAVGEITKVIDAHKKLQAAQLAMSKATTSGAAYKAFQDQERVVRSLSGSENNLLGMMGKLGDQFHKLERAVAPQVIHAFASALRILGDLMPTLIPLAKAAGRAIGRFLDDIDNWLKSGSGQKFLKWMRSDGPHAIETFGHVMFDIVQGIGQTFSFLRNAGNSWLRNFRQAWHDGARLVDWFRETFINIGHGIEAVWNSLHDKADSVNAGIRHAFATVVSFIVSIPGRVAGALSSVFQPLISAGESAVNFIAGIVSKIQGFIGSINGALGGIPGKLLHIVGLEHGGIVGAQGGGPRSRMTMVGEHGREMLRLPPGTQVMSNPDTERMMSGASGGAQVITIEWVGGAGADREFLTWLKRNIRFNGGNPAVLGA